MNWKIIVVGGIAMYAAQFLMSFATGPLIHDGVLLEAYEATESFWRPELTQDPPDMAALYPRWLTVGILTSLVLAGVYSALRSGFTGPGWQKGLKYGFVLFLVSACWAAGWSGIFNLPEKIWAWWVAESLLYTLLGGLVLGWVAQKLAPE